MKSGWLWEVVDFAGFAYLITSGMIMFWTYTEAFFHDGEVVVGINYLGELVYELPVMVLGVVCAVLFLARFFTYQSFFNRGAASD